MPSKKRKRPFDFANEKLESIRKYEYQQDLETRKSKNSRSLQLLKSGNESPVIYGRDTDVGDYVWLQGSWIPITEVRHSFAIGEPESGKSLQMGITLSSILKTIKPPSNRRALIFDTQGDYTAILAGQDLPYIPLDLSTTGYSWDMATDYQDSDHILSLCYKLFPKQSEGGDNAFFLNAARVIFFGIWSSLSYRHGNDFTFRDVYLGATADIATQKTILQGYPQGKQIIDIFFDSAADKTLDNIRMELFTDIEHFAPVAAHCQRAGTRTISLDKILQSEGVIVIRQDLSALEASKPFVQAFFERYVELVNARQGFEYPPSDFIFADELEFLEFVELPALRKAATFSRKKGLVLILATQTIGGLYRKGNKEDADTILGCCPNKALFRTECAETATWGARQFGRKQIEEYSYSKSRSMSGLSWSMNTQQQVRDVLQTGDIQNLPFPNQEVGLIGHFRSKVAGTEIYKCISGEEIELLKPRTRPVPYQRTRGFNQPQPWTPIERKKYVSGSATRDAAGKSSVEKDVSPFAAFDEALRQEIFDITTEELERIIRDRLGQ